MGKLDEAVEQIKAQQEKEAAEKRRRQDEAKAQYDFMVATTKEALQPIKEVFQDIKEQALSHTPESYIQEVSDHEHCSLKLFVNSRPFSARINHNNPHIVIAASNTLPHQGKQYELHQIKDLKSDLITWAARAITHT
jgi:hypothetical protein